jgi:hypothetical protein
MLFTIPMATCCTLDPASMARALNLTEQLVSPMRWRPLADLCADTGSVGRNKINRAVLPGNAPPNDHNLIVSIR